MVEMRDSDWSRPKLLRSDWLLPSVALCTTYKHPARFVKKIAKKDFFLSLNFNIDTNLDNREKVRDRNI